MTVEYKAVSNIISSLNAVSLNLQLHDLLQEALEAGSVSDAEMITYMAYTNDKIREDDYHSLMFCFERLDDVI